MAIEYICAVIPVSAMVGAGAVVLTRMYFSNTRRMTSHVTGEVVRAEPRVKIVDGRRQVETALAVKYVVSGREHEITRTIPGERAAGFPPGRPVTVRYNPAEPTMADLVMP